MRCSIVSLSSETVFDIAGKRAEKDRLAAQMGQAGFWDNQEKAQQIIQQLKPLNGLLNPYEDLERAVADVRALGELTEEDPSLETDMAAELTKVEKSLDDFEM